MVKDLVDKNIEEKKETAAVEKTKEVPEKKEKPKGVRGGNLRRILAELADFFVCFVLAITLYGVCFQKAFGYEKYSSEMRAISDQQTSIFLSHHLYEKDDKKTLLVKTDLEERWFYYYLSKQDDLFDSKKTSECLRDYYVTARQEGFPLMSQKEYNVIILGLPSSLEEQNSSPYFVYDLSRENPLDSEPIFSSKTQDNLSRYLLGNKDAYDPQNTYKALSSFFSKAYDSAANEIVKEETYMNLTIQYASVMWKRAYLQSAAIICSYLLGAIISFLLIPLIQLSGLTLGKRAAKLEVCDREGSKPKWYAFLIRGLVETICYCFAIPFIGVISFGFGAMEMPFLDFGQAHLSLSFFAVLGLLLSLSSLILLFATPNRQSLHDLASMTYVNTTDVKKIRDAEEQLKKKEGETENGTN